MKLQVYLHTLFMNSILASVLLISTGTLHAQTKGDSLKTKLHDHPELSFDIGQKFSLIGQVGFRLEYIHNERFAESDETADDDHRFRERVRLRFGGEFKPSEKFTAGFRLSTGQSTYPASGWSSFSDAFRRDPIAVDRVYINLNLDRFRFQFGSNQNSMYNQLVSLRSTRLTGWK